MRWMVFGGLLMSTMVVLFTNCSGSNSSTPPTAPVITQAYSAWNPPLGEPVAGGVTLYDGWQDPHLVASPVNIDGLGGWTDSVTVSRDGLNLYFAYTKNDYFTFESSFIFKSTGPARTAENTTDSLQIFQATLGPTGWAVKYHPVNISNLISSASIGVNANQDLMGYTDFYFDFDPLIPNKVTGLKTVVNLAALQNGQWQHLGKIDPPVNGTATCASGSELADDNPFIVGNLTSGTIYFESKRTNNAGTACGSVRHLYFVTNNNGVLSAAQPVPGISSNANEDDSQPFVTEDKSKIFWTSTRQYNGALTYGTFTATWNGTSYSNIRPVALANTFAPPFANKVVRIGEPNIVELAEGSIMYFTCGIAQGDTLDGKPDNIQMRVCFARKPK